MNLNDLKVCILENHPTLEVKGITINEHTQLETLIGYSIPEEYTIFLNWMGHKSGPVQAQWESKTIDIRFKRVLGQHLYSARKLKENPRYGQCLKSQVTAFQKYILFGINLTGNDNGHYYFDRTHAELPVYELTETMGEIKRSPSLIEFFFFKPFPKETISFLSAAGYPRK